MKWWNRLRRRLARRVEPPRLWSSATHAAYPEIQAQDDGGWAVRFYAYAPVGWQWRGKRYDTCPAFPEPTAPHPTTFPPGQAPAAATAAWEEYYRERPQAITELEEITGRARDKAQAQTQAQKALRRKLDKYRRPA